MGWPSPTIRRSNYTIFFISNTFISNARRKLVKNKQMLSNTLRLNSCYLKIIHIVYSRYHLQITWHILKNKQKNECVWKWGKKGKDISHRYDINRPRSWHGHKYSKCMRCLSMILLICIKQYLSNVWSSFHQKVQQHWGWVEKKHCLLKKREVQQVQINIYQSNTCRKDLSWLHFDDQQRVRERQHVKDQQL